MTSQLMYIYCQLFIVVRFKEIFVKIPCKMATMPEHVAAK